MQLCRRLLKSCALGILMAFFICNATVSQGSQISYDLQIIGGQEAEEGAWPWMAALVLPGLTPSQGQFCGGTLIAPQWVVTAAHCVESSGTRANVDVILGTNNLAAAATEYERITAEQIYVHESFNPTTYDNDVALIKLTAASAQAPIPKLVSPSEAAQLTSEETLATVIGWGNTSTTFPNYPDMLMEVVVPIVANSVCQSAYSTLGAGVTDNMLCAGLFEGGKDSCQGDSGGPLMVKSGTADALAGIVSWGVGCAEPQQYGVYTRVSKYYDWIAAKVGTLGTPEPVVSMSANGQAALTLAAYGPVNINAQVSANDKAGESVDWWLGYLGPYGNRWMNSSGKWVVSETPVTIGSYPLVDIPELTVYASAGLAPGPYLFFLILDAVPNGVLDDISWFDYVTVFSGVPVP